MLLDAGNNPVTVMTLGVAQKYTLTVDIDLGMSSSVTFTSQSPPTKNYKFTVWLSREKGIQETDSGEVFLSCILISVANSFLSLA